MNKPRMPAPVAAIPCRRSRRSPFLLTMVISMWCALPPSQTEGAGAPASVVKSDDEIGEARNAMAADPAAEAPVRTLVDLLARASRKREALLEADRFVNLGTASALLRAQRGFLRRELNDPRGAADDFAAALAGEGLSEEQRRNVQTGLTEAQAADALAQLVRAQTDLAAGNYVEAAQAAHLLLERDSEAEPAMFIRVEALAGAGRKREALTEANRFLQRAAPSPLLQARRGFLRRELNDVHGAAQDFAAALSGNGLTPEQRRNVQTALVEAQTTERAQAAQEKASAKPAVVPRLDPNSDAAIRARIDALTRAGRKPELQAEIDRLIARGHAPGWAYAQRGFVRRDAEDYQGAAQDFDAALSRGDLERGARPNVRYARAEAVAMQAEREGHPQQAEASYRTFLQTEPERADGWFKLGYLLLKQKRRAQGADALTKGLAIRPVGAAYLDAANAYIFTNAPLASKQYRQGLDRWYAGDASLAGRSQTDLERIKNEVVEADATIRTTLSYGGISSRPVAAGGTNNSFGAETRIRFDGRYLPAVERLEAIARGQSGKDSNGARETDTAIGLRYRPIHDLNLYFGGALDHFFQPKSETEFVLNWGLGLGANAYPYATGWKPYWDFTTFGAWRTADRRVLEDVRANAGFLYEFRSPLRGAVGPTLLAVAGYDNQAATPWATGVGPSVLSYLWLGGDKYRSYDAVLTLQLGYIFNVGSDQRQRGWRGQISLTF